MDPENEPKRRAAGKRLHTSPCQSKRRRHPKHKWKRRRSECVCGVAAAACHYQRNRRQCLPEKIPGTSSTTRHHWRPQFQWTWRRTSQNLFDAEANRIPGHSDLRTVLVRCGHTNSIFLEGPIQIAVFGRSNVHLHSSSKGTCYMHRHDWLSAQ